MAKYKKCFPSGRKNGQRWEEYTAGSSFVSGIGEPPLILICESGAIGDAEKTITPLGLHAAPRPSCASHSACAVVPLSSNTFILPSAKNPIERPSGDQKGKMALLVSGSSLASAPFIGRTQIDVLPLALVAVNAM